MTAYIVVDIHITDPAVYERYRRAAALSLEPYGGRYLVRGGATEVLEGSWMPGRVVILAFPTPAQARAWWSSSEYAPIKAIRHQSADSSMLLVEGVDIGSD
jgi:uncharacterized protein (DUF1330 family)